MPVFFYSAQDPAGCNAAEALRMLKPNNETAKMGFRTWRFQGFDLVEIPERTLDFQRADVFKTDLAVFLSKHKSASSQSCFTVHLTGNWGDALYGGAAHTLSRASAFWLKRFFLALKGETGHQAFLEATHHGPTLETPSLFVEIGSTEEEWVKKENGEALAEVVLSGLQRENDGKVALGFGGTHYCSSFASLLEQDWALSHVASKHALDFVTKDLVKQAMKKTAEPVEMVFLDVKGMTADKRKSLETWCGELELVCEAV